METEMQLDSALIMQWHGVICWWCPLENLLTDNISENQISSEKRHLEAICLGAVMIHVKSCARSRLTTSYWTWLCYVQFFRSCHRKEDLLSHLHISSDKIVLPWNVSGKRAPPRLHFCPGMCFQRSFAHSYKCIKKTGPVTQQKKGLKDQ